jgi:hypothetical protein
MAEERIRLGVDDLGAIAQFNQGSTAASNTILVSIKGPGSSVMHVKLS